jgi:hypothetical protein
LRNGDEAAEAGVFESEHPELVGIAVGNVVEVLLEVNFDGIRVRGGLEAGVLPDGPPARRAVTS